MKKENKCVKCLKVIRKDDDANFCTDECFRAWQTIQREYQKDFEEGIRRNKLIEEKQDLEKKRIKEIVDNSDVEVYENQHTKNCIEARKRYDEWKKSGELDLPENFEAMNKACEACPKCREFRE